MVFRKTTNIENLLAYLRFAQANGPVSRPRGTLYTSISCSASYGPNVSLLPASVHEFVCRQRGAPRWRGLAATPDVHGILLVAIFDFPHFFLDAQSQSHFRDVVGGTSLPSLPEIQALPQYAAYREGVCSVEATFSSP